MSVKKSIRGKMLLILISMIAAITLLTLLLNNLFLTPYYMYSKKQSLMSAYDSINKHYLDELITDDGSRYYSDGDHFLNDFEELFGDPYATELSDQLKLEMEQISTNQNLSIIIYRDMYDSLSFFSSHQGQKLLLFSSLGMNQKETVEANNIYTDYISAEDKNVTSVKATDHYVVNNVNVQRLGSRYLYLDGLFDNGDHVLIRASVAGLTESVHWANRFYLYISLLVGLIGILAVNVVSNRFLKPIKTLNEIASHMSELDFSQKYHVTTEDEVGQLGNSINVLSENLEETLNELNKANEQLREDIRQKEKIDEMRKEFLSNVSHELKTPIALIQGYAEGLSDNINDDEESRTFYCDVIMDEARKMNNMVRKITALNQLEFGYEQVSMDTFDLVDLINGVLVKSEILIHQKEARVCFKQTGPVSVYSDPYMVEEIFTNYLTNALNHVKDAMTIEIRLQEMEHAHIRVGVFNTGDPIPENDLGRIWDKFYKVDKARTREYGGSGVGLSIVKASMELLGNPYGVINEADGVTFWFELDKDKTGASPRSVFIS